MDYERYVRSIWKDHCIRITSDYDNGFEMPMGGKTFFVPRANGMGGAELYVTDEQINDLWKQAAEYTGKYIDNIRELRHDVENIRLMSLTSNDPDSCIRIYEREKGNLAHVELGIKNELLESLK